MLSLLKLGLSEYAEKPRFWAVKPQYLRNIQAFLGDIFLGTLDTYTKKMNPPLAVLGGGGAR